MRVAGVAAPDAFFDTKRSIGWSSRPPDDAKALKATVSTFPKSAFYDLGALLTQLGIGGGVGALGAFLKSRQGKQLENQVLRGVFGLIKKRP